MAVPEAIDLVDLAIKATAAYNRPDLSSRLRHTRARLVDPNVRVLVVGEFKQGKSQLVNALVNASVCPVDDDIATSLPTVVRYAETPGVTLVRERESDSGEALPAERTDVPVAQLAQYVSEAGNPGNRRQLTYAEVGLPRRLLQGGLVLVDTPGVGGLGSTHGAATMGALPRADAVLLVSDAAQEYTKPELDFLSAARRLCPNVACVITKTDLYPQWRRIVELSTGHLGRAGLASEVFPVSSTLRLHALRMAESAAAQDTQQPADTEQADAEQAEQQELMEESGYVALIGYLQRGVLGKADELDRRSVCQDVLAVCEQVSAGMRSELSACDNPELAAELIATLTQAKGMA
nr:dynamin family protein [Pseudonocardiales bacterium]